MRQRIGIFGGSFNPPHNGHVAICKYLLSKNDVDEIWVIPVYRHPFGKQLVEFDDRMMMCKFAFGEFQGKVKILDVEKKLGNMSYTIDTIEHLQEQHPNNKFYLVMGKDSSDEASLWKDAKKLETMVQFITVPRGPTSFIPDISSSTVRDTIHNHGKFADLVPREVAVYIVTHGLYA